MLLTNPTFMDKFQFEFDRWIIKLTKQCIAMSLKQLECLAKNARRTLLEELRDLVAKAERSESQRYQAQRSDSSVARTINSHFASEEFPAKTEKDVEETVRAQFDTLKVPSFLTICPNSPFPPKGLAGLLLVINIEGSMIDQIDSVKSAERTLHEHLTKHLFDKLFKKDRRQDEDSGKELSDDEDFGEASILEIDLDEAKRKIKQQAEEAKKSAKSLSELIHAAEEKRRVLDVHDQGFAFGK